MRIEVGYGLEGTLTDAMSSRIIRNEMTPQFKSGNFDRGVENGVNAIVARLEGGAEPAAEPRRRRRGTTPFGVRPASTSPTCRRGRCASCSACFIFGIIGLFTVIGVMTPGVGWFLYLFLIPFWAMFPIIIVGVKGALDAARRSTSSASRSRSSIVSRSAGTRRRRGSEDEGHGDDRRLHDELRRRQRLELVVGQLVVRRLLGRRRQLRRRRQLGQLVVPARGTRDARSTSEARRTLAACASRARTPRRRSPDRRRVRRHFAKPAASSSAAHLVGAYHVVVTVSCSSASRCAPRRCA